MTPTAKRIAALIAVITVNLILFSCSGPTAPQKGTPAFYWQAAREAYAAGDHLRTIQNLDSIVAGENEFTGRARTWLLVMTSGLARGYMEIADFYESGARINKSNRLAFHKQVSNCRNGAGRMALRFAEVIGDHRKSQEDPVVLDFPYPTGSPAPSPILLKVGNGILPSEIEMETAQKAGLTRNLILAVCDAVSAPKDPAKAQALFKAGPVKVPRAEFNLTMARVLYDQSQLFTSTKLDQPERLKIFCSQAEETLKTVPASKVTKELDEKIKASLKKIKKG